MTVAKTLPQFAQICKDSLKQQHQEKGSNLPLVCIGGERVKRKWPGHTCRHMYLTRSYLPSYVPDKVIPAVIFATKPGDIVIGCHTFATVLVI